VAAAEQAKIEQAEAEADAKAAEEARRASEVLLADVPADAAGGV